MITDGLTKTLPRQLHEEFVRQIRLDDISKRIQQEKRMVDLQDKMHGDSQETTVFLLHKGEKGPKEARLAINTKESS